MIVSARWHTSANSEKWHHKFGWCYGASWKVEPIRAEEAKWRFGKRGNEIGETIHGSRYKQFQQTSQLQRGIQSKDSANWLSLTEKPGSAWFWCSAMLPEMTNVLDLNTTSRIKILPSKQNNLTSLQRQICNAKPIWCLRIVRYSP